jgi:NAD(P)-dependent dehydrogenase (short-subunit alcohol dehydrogenase family)
VSKPLLVLVTGSTDGIGMATALALAARGAAVIVHGRNRERAEAAAHAITAQTAGQGAPPARAEIADLASLDEVRALGRRLVAAETPMDVLINNAGVFEKQGGVTRDGFETTFAVNHLAPVLLTHLCLPLLSPQARVLTVSSTAHMAAQFSWAEIGPVRGDGASSAPELAEKPYDGFQAYALSKLGNVLFSTELARRLGRTGITANSLHPGVVPTKLLRTGWGKGGPDSPEEAGAAIAALALAQEYAGVSGEFYVRGSPAVPHPVAADTDLVARFYELSCRLVGVAPLPAVTAPGPRPATRTAPKRD